MKRYFLNLWEALLGRNPYRAELERMMEDCATLDAQHSREVKSYQTLVENLRQRLHDKDELMKRMKDDYQERIEQYNAKIDELRNKEKAI